MVSGKLLLCFAEGPDSRQDAASMEVLVTFGPSLKARQLVPVWFRCARALSVLVLSAAFLALPSGFTGLASARSTTTSVADLAERLLPAVVNISTSQTLSAERMPDLPQFPPGSPFEDFFKEFFERGAPGNPHGGRRATSLGSGFIIDPEGYIVTNNHVIQDADEITIILSDETALKAKLVGRDSKVDIALLKVDAKRKLPHVEFGDSDKARVGEEVIAIGNPLGLGGSVTTGIISAKTRDINFGPYDSFIQTDAAINKGNSGGPLFNMDGQVIGVNTSIYSPSGGNIGIAFAAPSNLLRQVLDDIRKYGRTRRGWLGVRIQSVTDEIAESIGLKKAYGALVASAEAGSPAESAGIQSGDVIIEWNGKEVKEMRRLPVMVAETEINQSVPVVVWRNGERVKIKVKVGELKDDEPLPVAGAEEGAGPADQGAIVQSLGFSLLPLGQAEKKRYNIPDDAKGMIVADVLPSGAAAEKGIRPGDVLVEVNQSAVASVAEVEEQIKKVREKARKSVLLLFQNASGMRFVALPITG